MAFVVDSDGRSIREHLAEGLKQGRNENIQGLSSQSIMRSKEQHGILRAEFNVLSDHVGIEIVLAVHSPIAQIGEMNARNGEYTFRSLLPGLFSLLLCPRMEGKALGWWNDA